MATAGCAEGAGQAVTAFLRLTRPLLRALGAGESVTEHGITFTRLASGDGRWSINVMANRRRVHQVIGTEREGITRTQAEEAVQRVKAGKRERALGITRARPGTLQQAASAYLAHLEATGGRDVPKKRQRFDLHVCRLLGGAQLAHLTRTDLKRYATARAGEGAAPATINRELAAVSHLLGVAADPEGLALLPGIPFRVPLLKEPRGRPVYLKPEEAGALLAAAAADPSPHIYAFCMVGLHTGMRLSAILRLRVEELDHHRRVIWVDRDKAGERQQPMTRELSDFLASYARGRGLDGWLFPAPDSATGHAVNITKAFRRAVAAAGLNPAVTPHKLRHTMATNAAHRGIDAATLQVMGGWKSRVMVERYTHAAAISDAMDKLQEALAVPPAPGAGRARRRRITPGLQRGHGRA